MLLSLAACAAPAAETAPSETPTPTVSETATPTPTAEPTPTPEPTMSPEEIEEAENMAEYEKYKMYYETYGDELALVFIKDMLDEGKITADMLDDLNGPLGTFTDKATWEIFYSMRDEWTAILNGELEEMYPDALDTINTNLYEDCIQGILHITLLDTEEKRQRVISGAEIIDEFYANPTDVNRIKMENMLFSEELTPGEIRLLFTWLWNCPIGLKVQTVNANGKEYNTEDYIFLYKIDLYGKSIKDRDMDAYNKLIEMNNTPNTEKDWLIDNQES